MARTSDLIKSLLLLVIILVILALVMEGILRLTYPLYKNYNTEMWRYSVLLKRASSNPNASHEHIPNKEAFLYGVNISLNSHGFRDKEYSIEKSKNTYRIVVLGDSFTLGWGVEIDKVYSEVLEKKLNNNSKIKYEVINTALGNYNTQMEFELFKEKLLVFDPDMLIIGYYPNDPELTKKVNSRSLSSIFKKNSYTYAFFWDRVTNLKTNLRAKSENSYTGFVHDLYHANFTGRNVMEQSLTGIFKLAQKNDIKVAVIVLPQFFGDFKNYEFKEVHPTIKNISTPYNVTVIDMVPHFQNYEVKDVIVSFEDAHPNSLGHSIIANVLYENIDFR